MSRTERGARPLHGLLGWLSIGIGLAIGQNLLWPGVWAMTLLVWWSYLILTVVVLFRLLIHSRILPVRPHPRALLWTLVTIAALLWWFRPLWLELGEGLLDALRSPAVQPAPAELLVRKS